MTKNQTLTGCQISVKLTKSFFISLTVFALLNHLSFMVERGSGDDSKFSLNCFDGSAGGGKNLLLGKNSLSSLD